MTLRLSSRLEDDFGVIKLGKPPILYTYNSTVLLNMKLEIPDNLNYRLVELHDCHRLSNTSSFPFPPL